MKVITATEFEYFMRAVAGLARERFGVGQVEIAIMLKDSEQVHFGSNASANTLEQMSVGLVARWQQKRDVDMGKPDRSAN